MFKKISGILIDPCNRSIQIINFSETASEITTLLHCKNITTNDSPILESYRCVMITSAEPANEGQCNFNFDGFVVSGKAIVLGCFSNGSYTNAGIKVKELAVHLSWAQSSHKHTYSNTSSTSSSRTLPLDWASFWSGHHSDELAKLAEDGTIRATHDGNEWIFPIEVCERLSRSKR